MIVAAAGGGPAGTGDIGSVGGGTGRATGGEGASSLWQSMRGCLLFALGASGSTFGLNLQRMALCAAESMRKGQYKRFRSFKVEREKEKEEEVTQSLRESSGTYEPADDEDAEGTTIVIFDTGPGPAATIPFGSLLSSASSSSSSSSTTTPSFVSRLPPSLTVPRLHLTLAIRARWFHQYALDVTDACRRAAMGRDGDQSHTPAHSRHPPLTLIYHRVGSLFSRGVCLGRSLLSLTTTLLLRLQINKLPLLYILAIPIWLGFSALIPTALAYATQAQLAPLSVRIIR